MDLIERYLHAVEFWLPTGQKQDILAELAEDIHAQVEERQAVLGRSLTRDEIADLLEGRGRPLMVANRFQPQRSLIGPVLFPIYLFVVKAVGLFYLIPGFLVTAVIYRTQHAGASWFRTLGVAGSDIWSAGLFALGIITAVFAGLQLSGFAERELVKWNPRKLPPVKGRNRISRVWSVTNIVANLIFLLWWIPCFSSPEILRGPAVSVTLEPAWMHFFWAFLVTGVWNIGLGIANLLHPQWSRLRAGCYLAGNLASGLLFCWMTRTHLIASLSMASLGPVKSAVLTRALQATLAMCFPIVLIVTVIVLIVDLMRVLRAGASGSSRPGAAVKGPVSV
jgi:hypothetical protein